MPEQISLLDGMLLLKEVVNKNGSSDSSKPQDKVVYKFNNDQLLLLQHIESQISQPYTDKDYSKIFLNLDEHQEVAFNSMWKTIIGKISREDYKTQLLQRKIDALHRNSSGHKQRGEDFSGLFTFFYFIYFILCGSVTVIFLIIPYFSTMLAAMTIALGPLAFIALVTPLVLGVLVVPLIPMVISVMVTVVTIELVNSRVYSKKAMDILNKECENEIKTGLYKNLTIEAIKIHEKLNAKFILYNKDMRAVEICQEVYSKTKGEPNDDITLCDGFNLIAPENRAYLIYKGQNMSEQDIEKRVKFYVEGETVCGKDVKAVTLYVKYKMQESISQEEQYYITGSWLTKDTKLASIYMDIHVGKPPSDFSTKKTDILYVKGLIDYEKQNTTSDRKVADPRINCKHAEKYLQTFQEIEKSITKRLDQLHEKGVITPPELDSMKKELSAINDLGELEKYGYENILKYITDTPFEEIDNLLSVAQDSITNTSEIKKTINQENMANSIKQCRSFLINANQKIKEAKAKLHNCIEDIPVFKMQSNNQCSNKKISEDIELFCKKYESPDNPKFMKILATWANIKDVERKINTMSLETLGKGIDGVDKSEKVPSEVPR